MLTLITGTPGSFKTLMTVWDMCRSVPGSSIEGADGHAVQRTLYSNITDLVIPHERIEAEDMNRWHEWAKPGAVIVFDEVQHVWRPRSAAVKVPACIEALETHRHMGVDIVLITQHPMLVDQNVRRLVNRHIHMRRISVGLVYRYEWDHCSIALQYKAALNSGVWRRPKAAFGLYKSAQVHTKSTARLPRVAVLGLAAVVGLAYLGPAAYGRLTTSLGAGGGASSGVKGSGAGGVGAVTKPGMVASGAAGARGVPLSAPEPMPGSRGQEREIVGCVRTPERCFCFDASGTRVLVDDAACRDRTPAGDAPVDLAKHPFMGESEKAEPSRPEDLEVLAFMRGGRR